jgi:tetratricopeptide (TPR) repeat protein
MVGDKDEAKQLHGTLESSNSVDDSSDCLYYYALGQPALASQHCDAMITASKDSNIAWSNAGYVALDNGDYKTAVTYFVKARGLYDDSKIKHTVAEELDLTWGLTLAAYYSGDKKDARSLYRAIKKTYPDFSAPSSLRQLPLVWSDNTLALVEKVVAEFK